METHLALKLVSAKIKFFKRHRGSVGLRGHDGTGDQRGRFGVVRREGRGVGQRKRGVGRGRGAARLVGAAVTPVARQA